MSQAEAVLPRVLHVGGGTRKRLASVLRTLGASRPLVVTDRTMVDLGYLAELVEDLARAGITAGAFTDTVPEPTAASIVAGVEAAKASAYDSIVALAAAAPSTAPRPSRTSWSTAARSPSCASHGGSTSPACPSSPSRPRPVRAPR